MSIKTIDCSGLSCPEPVLRVRRALMEDASLRQVEVKVSAAAARDNVSRMVRGMGWQVAVQPEEDGFRLKLLKSH